MTLALHPEVVEPAMPALTTTTFEGDGVQQGHSGPASVLFVDNRAWGYIP